MKFVGTTIIYLLLSCGLYWSVDDYDADKTELNKGVILQKRKNV